MYKNYVFDFYNTLATVQVDLNNDYAWNKFREFLAFNGAVYEVEELKERYFSIIKKYDNIMMDKDYSIEDLVYKIYKVKGIKAKKNLTKYTAQTFRMLTTQSLTMLNNIEQILQLLKGNNKSIYIVGNGQEVYTYAELKVLELYQYIDGICLSSNCGIKLPNKQLIKQFFEEYNLKEDESIIISGNKTTIDAASKINLNTMYLNQSEESSIELRSVI